jgi:hypothetical protein
MSNSPPHPRAAYFEEYNEDAHTTLPETRQTANVAAKRSKLEISKSMASQDGPDDASDSGNSNPLTSLDGGEPSSQEPKMVNPPPLKIDTTAGPGKPKTRDANGKSPGTPKKAPKTALKRADSKAQDSQPLGNKGCNCEECLAKKKRPTSMRKPSRQPEAHAPPLLLKKPEAPHPPSPLKPSRPQPIQIPIVQPAQVRPRSATTQTYRAAGRPVSFHAGAMPEYLYTQPVYIERRPGPAVLTGLSYPPPSFTPPKPLYFPPSLPAMPPRQEIPPMSPFPFEALPQPVPLPPGRPHPGQWASEPPPPLHQPMLFGTSPIVDYSRPHIYPISNPNPQPSSRRSFTQRERPGPLPEQTFMRDDDYFDMPPPPRPGGSSQQYRPTFRHAATTSAAHPTLHHTRSRRGDDNMAGLRGERSPRKTSPEKREPSSRPPLAIRHSAASGNDRLNLYPAERSTARMRVESSTAKQNRRASYYGYETPKDLERVVEAYQALKIADAARQELTADSLKLVRKKTQNSDTGSRNSVEGKRSREGSDVKPRNSTDRRGGSDVKSRTDPDGFTMRFPQGVNVDLKGGGVEGRTISLRQSGEGEGGMELSIGARGRNSGSRNETRDRSHRRTSYVEDGGSRELEYTRSLSRVPRAEREIDNTADRERKVAGSRSRRSSRTGYRDGRGFFG